MWQLFSKIYQAIQSLFQTSDENNKQILDNKEQGGINLVELLKGVPPERLTDEYAQRGLITDDMIQERLHQFEIQYDLPSGAFYEQWKQGNMADTLDFNMWLGLCDMAEELNIPLATEVKYHDFKEKASLQVTS